MLKFQKSTKSTKAFLLIEIIITLVIISVSFIFLIQGFMNILKISKINQDIIKALIIAENKISELESKTQVGILKSQTKEEIFNISYAIGPLKNLNLGELTLDINWVEKNKINQINLKTYLILEK